MRRFRFVALALTISNYLVLIFNVIDVVQKRNGL